ncbi:MAG TPA: cytochrome b, partial [Tistrella mobilis]|nr:cytochrome b [Tistrella mobilis]
LFLLPWLDTSRVRSAKFRPVFKVFYLLLVVDILALGWAGGQPAEGVAVVIGQIATAWYFLHFLVLLPLLGWFERPRPLPESIASAVLGDRAMEKA